MLLVFLTLGMTDLIFALDSIPAIFGLTKSPFIVFTANIFALMGLRQLYFLLGGLMERLIYLKHALSIILAFIGFKLIFHAMHENELPFINGGQHIEWAPDIPTSFSLIFILGTIVLAVVASLAVSKKREGREATEHQISRTAERVAHQQEVVARREAEAQAQAQAEAAESVEPGKTPEQR